MKKKLAIIGASYLQEPLIRKAKENGLETHVFAWAAGDVGESMADQFYPISIVEKDQILQVCQEIGIDGICSISSDLAAITVNYVASVLGLTGNSMECTGYSTNKHEMRKRFSENGDPSPQSLLVESVEDLKNAELHFPMIVKPLDRSGSRGITKVWRYEELPAAIENAKEQGFEKKALVEEFAGGQEYSVETVSWKGKHTVLAITEKFTTGSPHFIETGHLEPAPLSDEMADRVRRIVCHALDSLKIMYGASHSELKIDEKGDIKIIEIGGRMGGDLIGSDLVRLSAGIDFVQAVIDIALGKEPDLQPKAEPGWAAVRFIMGQEDLEVLERVKEEKDLLVRWEVYGKLTDEVRDSSGRHGYFLMQSHDPEQIRRYLPEKED